MRRIRERTKLGVSSEFRIQARWIDNVVAVLASAARGENRREIEMRYAEPIEVVDARARVLERERRVQLEAIRRGERL